MTRVERLLTYLMVAAALAVAAATVRREFFSGNGPGGPEPRDRQVSVADWDGLLRSSTPLGPVTSGPTLVVLTDFQCPACKSFHARLVRVFGERLVATDVRYAHLPLDYHSAALPAAKLFECAVRSEPVALKLADVLFAVQDSLQLLSPDELLRRAQVSNASGPIDCLARSDSSSFERIWRGMRIAKEVSVLGTPSVFLDGKLLALPPDEDRLRAIFGR